MPVFPIDASSRICQTRILLTSNHLGLELSQSSGCLSMMYLSQHKQTKEPLSFDHNTAMPPKSKTAKRKPIQQQPPADAAASGEEEIDVLWLNHPAREVLLNAFWNGDIPLDWNKKPEIIYNKIKDRKEFEGMPFDKDFKRRILKLRDIVKHGKKRVERDKIAFDIFRKNFPVQQFNKVGVLRWHGSLAQHYLKADMKAGLHKGKKPAEFRATRAEYQEYPKDTFRKHINQEIKLWKLEHFLEVKQQKDIAKAAAKAAKKAKAKAREKAKGKKKEEEKKTARGKIQLEEEVGDEESEEEDGPEEEEIDSETEL